MKYPKISIIIPAYKEEETIGDTLDYLIKKMKYPNLEILVGIDTLEDRTFEIAKKFAKKYRRIKIFLSKERRGFLVTMDFLIKRAAGEIIVKNDADIRIGNPSRALYELAKIYEDKSVGGATFRVIDSLESEKRKSLAARGEIFVERMVYDWYAERHPVIQGDWDLMILCNSFRKSLISGLGKHIVSDDMEFGHVILKKGYKIVVANIPYYPIGLAKDAKSLFLQKRRTAVALLNVSKLRGVKYAKYYLLILGHFLSNIYKYSLKDLIAFSYWCLIYSVSFIEAYKKRNRDIISLWIKYKREPRLRV